MAATMYQRNRARYLCHKWVDQKVGSLEREGYVRQVNMVWISMKVSYTHLSHPNGNSIKIYEGLYDVTVYKNGKIIQKESFL